MKIFLGYDSRSQTLQKSPLVGECMRGIIDSKYRTAYIDRSALIFSGDFVRLLIKYDDGAVSAALKRLRVSRAGTWWGECADGIFQLGALVQTTAIEKVVALTTEVLVNNPSWPLRGASPEEAAYFAEFARDVTREWESLGHVEGVRFPGLAAVNYYTAGTATPSPTYQRPEPLCCPI